MCVCVDGMVYKEISGREKKYIMRESESEKMYVRV